ncbi:hypothetical protein ABK040_004647 [Willaertia magna]
MTIENKSKYFQFILSNICKLEFGNLIFTVKSLTNLENESKIATHEVYTKLLQQLMVLTNPEEHINHESFSKYNFGDNIASYFNHLLVFKNTILYIYRNEYKKFNDIKTEIDQLAKDVFKKLKEERENKIISDNNRKLNRRLMISRTAFLGSLFLLLYTCGFGIVATADIGLGVTVVSSCLLKKLMYLLGYNDNEIISKQTNIFGVLSVGISIFTAFKYFDLTVLMTKYEETINVLQKIIGHNPLSPFKLNLIESTVQQIQNNTSTAIVPIAPVESNHLLTEFNWVTIVIKFTIEKTTELVSLIKSIWCYPI